MRSCTPSPWGGDDALGALDSLFPERDPYLQAGGNVQGTLPLSYVDRLGPAIVMNGLGQALATERAAAGAPPRKDDEKAHHELYVGLRNWLCREDGGVYPPDTDLLQEIMNHGLQCWTRPKRSVRTTRRLVSAPTVALGASRSWRRINARQKLAAGGAAHQPVTHLGQTCRVGDRRQYGG